MQDIIAIKAEPREKVGKSIAKKLRNSGRVPAIIYGGNKESIPISINQEDLKSILKSDKGINSLLRIQREAVVVDAMLKEIQYDYLQDTPIHVDFIRIDPKRPVVVSVPVRISGEAIGVKEEDGVFDFMTRTLELRCLPDRIPREITVDVSQLHAGHSIKVEDLKFADEIEMLSDTRSVICAVSAKITEEEAVAEAVPVEGEEPAPAGDEPAADSE
ncbi:MAG: 50S ribosomal protein L25 [Acidobacteriota bacterium]|jgi:large subunit ribosomal protein L25|nr:50S ribosomal protein L25 [Acidobacteriota bacterium]